MRRGRSFYDWSEDVIKEAVSHCQNYAETLRYLDYPYNNKGTLVKKIKQYNINIDHFTFRADSHNSGYIPVENYFKIGTHIKAQDLRKKLVKEGYKEDKCEICGCPSEWQGKPLTLQVHHINGNSSDNRLENLQILCPNCHTQTDNYTGKNTDLTKKINYCKICGAEVSWERDLCPKCSVKERTTPCTVDKETLLKDFIELKNFTQQANKYGITTVILQRWYRDYELPSKVKELKEYIKNYK